VSAGFNATAEIAAANYPNIRVFTVGQGTKSNTPLADLQTVEQNWTAATPASIGGAGPGNGDFEFFSAICYFFARDLYNALGGTVPIGAVSNNWGGTCLQLWAPDAVTDACGMPGNVPSLYNAMIAPLTVGPMAVSGFLWSQGECNADSNTTDFYACAFRPFIDAWRGQFGAPSAFFGFELLPAYIRDASFSPVSLPFERAAQLTALAGDDPFIVTANGMDLGDPTAPHGSVHPRNKQTVAARFAAAALPLLYGRPAAYLNPAYRAAAAVTAGTTATVTVTFDPASVGAGLTIVPNACPTAAGVPADECAWHEIQTADGVWYNATAAVTPGGSGVTLTATIATAGVAVNATRSSFSPWPVVTLYNSAGFPALPWWAPVDSAAAA
jgi:sialate O-acetylesterase